VRLPDIFRPTAPAQRHRAQPANKAFVADFDADGIEKHQRIAGIEWPVLPFADLVQHCICHCRYQIGRNVDAAEFLEMGPDLTHGHAAGIYGDDLIVELGKPALILGNQLGIECAGPASVTFDVPIRTDFFE
jgi:hypothetical protein